MHVDPQDGFDDTFVISSATALTMGEQLLFLMNTVAQNLPEAELRMLRNSLGQSLALADDLLYSISLSSRLDVLTINGGTYAVSSAFCPFFIPASNKGTAPPVSDLASTAGGSRSLGKTSARILNVGC